VTPLAAGLSRRLATDRTSGPQSPGGPLTHVVRDAIETSIVRSPCRKSRPSQLISRRTSNWNWPVLPVIGYRDSTFDWGRSSGAAPKALLGSGPITNVSDPPATMSRCEMYDLLEGLPFNSTDWM
jgi:hypothetical protein